MTRMNDTRKRLETALDGMPAKTVEQVADFAEYLKSRDEWDATMELLNDPAMREDIEQGRAQAQNKNGHPWREVQKRVRS